MSDPEHNQPELSNRELRLRIGRTRRRINSRLRTVDGEARRLTSWKTYAKSFPGNAMLGAFGIGLALSAGLGGRRIARALGFGMFSRATGSIGRHVWDEVERIWNKSSGGGQDEQA